MRYQPWKPWDPYGLWDNADTTDGEKAAFGLVALAALSGLVVFGIWDNSVKNSHINDPIVITKSLGDDKKRTQYHAEDTRGLFSRTYNFIVAQNKADSAYAESKNLDLGEFDANKVMLSKNKSKGPGWYSPETMNFKIAN